MNAYELADDLENSNGLQYITKVGLVSLSAQMLRQQADRIAELEKAKIRAYDNGYEDGQKAVAWIDPKELDMDVSTTATKNKQFDTDIPLYTTPQIKKLNDEEILQFRDKVPYSLGSDLIDFARAILKKASEK